MENGIQWLRPHYTTICPKIYSHIAPSLKYRQDGGCKMHQIVWSTVSPLPLHVIGTDCWSVWCTHCAYLKYVHCSRNAYIDSSPLIWLNYVLHISFCTNMPSTEHCETKITQRKLLLEWKRKLNGEWFWSNHHFVIHISICIIHYIYALNKHKQKYQNWINTNDGINVTRPLTWKAT